MSNYDNKLYLPIKNIIIFFFHSIRFSLVVNVPFPGRISNLFDNNVAVLQRLLGADVGPNKVIEIKTDSLGNLSILQRHEGMVLYGPAVGQIENRRIQYEIVLNRPCADNLNAAYR